MTAAGRWPAQPYGRGPGAHEKSPDVPPTAVRKTGGAARKAGQVRPREGWRPPGYRTFAGASMRMARAVVWLPLVANPTMAPAPTDARGGRPAVTVPI